MAQRNKAQISSGETHSPDTESLNIKYPYPKAIAFIVTNEFCERFSYYGLRTILSLYLRDKLGYDDNGATVIYHVFSMLVYFFPLLGAMIADSWLGRFRTIFYLSMVYACGNILISLTAIPVLSIPIAPFTMIALLLIAVGTGGIKPCVSAFGGDQFRLPQQTRQLAAFFSLFYFAINAGSVLSTFLTPILRHDVHCFGDDDCYSLAFGVPGILMIVSIIIFVIGKSMYVIQNPSGNVFLDVTKCISHAIARKCRSKEKRDHWLDHAEDKYDQGLISDVKGLLSVLLLFIPLPVFWALFDQQGSRWTFQADRMDQQIGSWTLKADQMQVANPLMILFFIPVFELVIYPVMTWCKLIRKPLHKMIWGGMLAALAFVISGIVELQLLKTYPVYQVEGFAQLRVYNGYPCNLTFNSSDLGNFEVEPLSMYHNLHVDAKGNISLPYTLRVEPGNGCEALNLVGQFELEEATAISYFARQGELYRFKDNNDKAINGVNVRILSNIIGGSSDLDVQLANAKTGVTVLQTDTSDMAQTLVTGATYNLIVAGNQVLSSVELKPGAVYNINLYGNSSGSYSANVETITPPNTVHILWLIPQYVIITMGEVMFSVTGLEFSFTQAPASMKSVLQSVWLLTVALGNVIVILIVESKIFSEQWKEFFLFAGLMVIDMLIFTVMAFRYKYAETPSSYSDEDADGIKMSKHEEPQSALALDNPNFKGD